MASPYWVHLVWTANCSWNHWEHQLSRFFSVSRTMKNTWNSNLNMNDRFKGYYEWIVDLFAHKTIAEEIKEIDKLSSSYWHTVYLTYYKKFFDEINGYFIFKYWTGSWTWNGFGNDLSSYCLYCDHLNSTFHIMKIRIKSSKCMFNIAGDLCTPFQTQLFQLTSISEDQDQKWF